MHNLRANFKTSHFARSLRLAPILILEIRAVFLWVKLAPSLTLDKLKRFETGSLNERFKMAYAQRGSSATQGGLCQFRRGAGAAVVLALLFVISACALRPPVDTRTIGAPHSARKVLIATEQTPYKQAVVEQVLAHLQEPSIYTRIVDVTDLPQEDAGSYSAVVVLNSCFAWHLRPTVTQFLNQNDHKERVIILVTAANPNWQSGVSGVDAMTSASQLITAEAVAHRINTAIDRRLERD